MMVGMGRSLESFLRWAYLQVNRPMRRAPIAFLSIPRLRPDLWHTARGLMEGFPMRADRDAVGSMSARHAMPDAVRWALSTVLAVVVVALLLLIGMMF
jgi:hypothetical protein